MKDPVQTVVGAGPAGLAAAITFAKAGMPVRVLERRPVVGGRFHGDTQGVENWSRRQDVLTRLRQLGIDTNFPYRAFNDVTFYDSRLHETSAHTDVPLFYLVRRGPGNDTIDSALLHQARDAGAEVCFNSAADRAGPGAILATGPRQSHAIAGGFVFPTALEDQARAIVHPDLAPGGYAYLLVWEGRATLATCLFRDFDRWREARSSTVTAFRRLVPGLNLDQAKPFGGFGAVFARPAYTDRSGRMYIGEAAGLQDAEWGFGIATALRSGVLAARSVVDGTDFAGEARREFNAARATGMVNRALLDRFPTWLSDPAVRFEARRPDLRRRLRRHWEPTRVKSLIAPILLREHGKDPTRVDRGCEAPVCDCTRCGCARGGADPVSPAALRRGAARPPRCDVHGGWSTS